MTMWKWSQTAASNATADATINWAEGMAPSAVNNSARAEMAAVAKYRDDVSGNLVTGGTSTAYTITTNQVLTALTDGFKVAARMNATNGASPTLSVDSLTAKPIRSVAGTNIATGALLEGSVWSFVYDSTDEGWIAHGAPSNSPTFDDLTVSDDLIVGDDASVGGDLAVTGAAAAATVQVNEGSAPSTPASGKAILYADTSGTVRSINDGGTVRILSRPLLHVRDQKNANTAGDAITSGDWRTRTLNTEVTNEITGASLSTNQITLPAGTYEINAWANFAFAASGNSNAKHKAKLRNVTDDSDTIVGSSETVGGNNSTGASNSLVRGRFTIAAEKDFELQHQASATGTGGTVSNFSVVEVYAEVMIEQVG